MHRKTSKVVVPPSPPPWIHNFTSRSSLAGFEIGIPPGQQRKERTASETKNMYSEKALPPIPTDAMDPLIIHPGSRIPLDLDLEPPFPPPRNARRFSFTASPTASTAGSTPKPFHQSSSRESKEMVSPVSPGNTTTCHHMSSDLNPAPLVVRQPVPINRTGSKIARLTGCDLSLAAPVAARQSNRESTESDFSDGSSRYSEPSPITSRDGDNPDRKDSEISLDSFVNNYSGWGSWAPSKESLEAIQRSSSDATRAAECQKCSKKSQPATETIVEEPARHYVDVGVSTSPSPSPSPPARTPPAPIPARSASRSCNRPLKSPVPNLAPERPARRKSPMALESLMGLERACYRRSSEKPFSPHNSGPFSPFQKISAMYQPPASRDSGFASETSGGVRPLSPGPLKPQNSMPVMGRETMSYNHGHARSISRFSLDSDDDDAVSIRSTASARISGAARGMRNSFVSHVRNVSLTAAFRTSTRPPTSRLSQVDAAEQIEQSAQPQHKHANSNSTAKSVTWTLGQRRLSSNSSTRPESPTPTRSRFATITETLTNPLRAHPASPSTPPPRPKRQTILVERKASNRGSRVIGIGRTTSIIRRNSRNTKNLTIRSAAAGRKGNSPLLSPNFSLPRSSPRPFANPHYTPSSSAWNSVLDLKEALASPSSIRGMKSPAFMDEPSSTRGVNSPTTFDDILELHSMPEAVPPTPSSTKAIKSPSFPIFSRRRTSLRRKSSVNSPAESSPGQQSPQTQLANGRRFSITGKNGAVVGGFDTASRTIGSPILIGGSVTMGEIHASSSSASASRSQPQRSETASPALGAPMGKEKSVKHKASRSFSVMASLEQGVERVRGRMGIKSREERVREEKAEEERRKEVLRGRIRVIMARAEDEVKVEVRRNKAAKTKVKEERPAGSQVVGWKEAAKESGEEKKWV